jgi:DNA-binding transcriptional LysR family regulator
MEVSSRDVAAFREVVLVKSISRAAERWQLTQPAVSAIIKKIERWMGLELLVRTGRGVQPTRAGERFFSSAQSLIEGWENLRSTVLEDHREMQGCYRIGAHSSVAIVLAPRFTAAILEAEPRLELHFVHELSRNIADAVINFQLDFGLVVNPPRHPDLVIRKLYTAEFGFWVKAKPQGPLQDPANPASVVICHPDLAQSQRIIALARRKNGLQSRRVTHSTDLQVIMALAASGAGIGVLPAGLVRHAHSKDLVSLPGFPTARDNVALVYRKDAQSSRAASFIKDGIAAALP